MDVLVRGAAKLDDAVIRATVRTGESLLPAVQVLPANIHRCPAPPATKVTCLGRSVEGRISHCGGEPSFRRAG